MNQRSNSLWFRFFFAIALTLAACQTTSIKSTNQGPAFANAKIRKLLVVSLGTAPAIRQLLENEFVYQLKRRKVDAVASYTVSMAEGALDKGTIAPYAKAHGFDTVLVNRLLSRQELDKDGQLRPIGQATPNPKVKDDLGWIIASAAYPDENKVAILRTTLYDATTEEMAWSAVNQTLMPKDVPKRIHSYVKVILTDLYQSR